MNFFFSRCFQKLLNTEGFGIQVWHWINLSAGTEFLSLPKLLTEIWLFRPNFLAYFHFHGFSKGNLDTFFIFLNF